METFLPYIPSVILLIMGIGWMVVRKSDANTASQKVEIDRQVLVNELAADAKKVREELTASRIANVKYEAANEITTLKITHLETLQTENVKAIDRLEKQIVVNNEAANKQIDGLNQVISSQN